MLARNMDTEHVQFLNILTVNTFEGTMKSLLVLFSHAQTVCFNKSERRRKRIVSIDNLFASARRDKV